jgi:hypothetical protein
MPSPKPGEPKEKVRLSLMDQDSPGAIVPLVPEPLNGITITSALAATAQRQRADVRITFFIVALL